MWPILNNSLWRIYYELRRFVVRLHYPPPPRVVALEEPPEEEGGHGEGWRLE